MGQIYDDAKQVYRAFETEGVPASGPNEPSKTDIIGLFQIIDSLVGGAISGATPIDTVAHLPASTGSGKIYLVTSDATTANNGYWQDQSGGNTILTDLNNALKGAPGADGTMVPATDSEATARTIDDKSLVPSNLPALGLPGAPPRSGWSHVWSDIAKRVLVGVSSHSGEFIANVASRFRSPVTFEQPIIPAFTTLGATTFGFPRIGGFRSGYRAALLDTAGRILGGQRNDGHLEILGLEIPTMDDIDGGASFLLPETGWAEGYGDSLMDNYSVTQPTVARLAGKIDGGFQFTKNGLGGQKSTQVSMRPGAVPIYLTLSGNAVPASASPVGVTAINGVNVVPLTTVQDPDYRFLSYGSASAPGSDTKTSVGYLMSTPIVHGTVTRTIGASPTFTETYTFTPDAAPLASVSVPAGTLFIPDVKETVFGRELWIIAGRNNFNQPVQVRADISAMVHHYKPTAKRILIWAIPNAVSETQGTSAWQAVVDLNNWLRDDHPAHFIVDQYGRDSRQYWVESGKTSDPSDYANDCTPTSQRITGDPLHPNDAGCETWAQIAYDFRQRTQPGV